MNIANHVSNGFNLSLKGEYKKITLVKMKHLNIDIILLRKLLPYQIRYNGNSKIGYILNRDYEYIDCGGKKSIDFGGNNCEYLFDNDNKPWDNLKNTQRLFDTFTKYIKLNNIEIKNITKTEILFNQILIR